MFKSNNYITSREDIANALRRNKRMGLKRSSMSDHNPGRDEEIPFLEWYVFTNLNTTPQEYIGNIETQYYAEQDFRNRRQRNIEFIRGRHFGEPVYDAELQRTVTQWEYLRRRNMPPLTYNVVSKLVRSLVGQFREINTGNVVKCDSRDERGVEIATLLTTCVDRVKKNNRYRSKDAMNFKEMLASGSPVYKQMWGTKGNAKKPDVKFRIVNRSNFMINPGVVDFDMDNLHTITEIHDTSLNDIIASFANGNYRKGMDIREGYMNYQGNEKTKSSYSTQSFDGSQNRNKSFHYQGIGNSAYRYYEVWTEISDYEAITFDPLDGIGTYKAHKFTPIEKVKSEIDQINKDRRLNAEGLANEEDILIEFKTDFVKRWYVMYITPWGMVLDVRESPYKSGLPPFVFPAPDINGEVWGLVEEVLSAQLSLDRQILQADAIVANASKGVWLVPDTAIPDTHTQKQYLNELKKVDGAVVYKVRDGAEDIIPKQIYANSANVSGNVQQLIQLYSNLVDEISGNYGAAQGKGTSSSTTATGYALESQNAGLNVRDIMENYLSLLVDRDEQILRFILDGYTVGDYKRVTGVELDPEEIKMFEFNIEQSKGVNSPAHRFALEQELLQLVYNQLLPFEVFMEISNNPIMIQAKQKYEEFKKKQTLMQQQAMEAEQQAKGGGGQVPNLQIPAMNGGNSNQLEQSVIQQQLGKSQVQA